MLECMKDYFYKGILVDDVRMVDGGEACAKQMSLDYKIFWNVILIVTNLLIIRYISLRKFNIIKKRKRYTFEYVVAFTLIATLIIQVINKIAIKSMMFLFNPCHLCVVKLKAHPYIFAAIREYA